MWMKFENFKWMHIVIVGIHHILEDLQNIILVI